MTRTAKNSRFVALAVTTALATTALGGCAMKAAPRSDLSANKAQVALEKGKTGRAIEHAEAAVLAEPRNAAYRAMLGAAYMEAGRFQSAATSFKDALSLGENAPRTALSYALAEIASGNNTVALGVLEDWREDLDPADYGLAMALAGRPGLGTHALANALRGGYNTPKVRQNLAYSYALQGNWRAARVMAAEDVPADKVGARLAEWARTMHPAASQARIAALLEVPVVTDAGQPVALALNNHPTAEQLAAEAATLAPAPIAPPTAASEYAHAAPAGELPPLQAVQAPVQATDQPAPQVATAEPASSKPDSFEAAFAAPAPTGATPVQVAKSAIRFISNPVVQKMPARYGAEPKPRGQRTASAAPAATGKHLIQLGSFGSRESARRAWGIYAKRYPQLDRYRMVITEARVRGKTYYRVSAGGFASGNAKSMCSTVKRSGHGCITWAEGRPLPGAVKRDTRMASR